MHDWIKVEEMLPTKKNQAYFTFCSDGEIHTNIWYDDNNNVWMEDSPLDFYGEYTDTVTHWMEFPCHPSQDS